MKKYLSVILFLTACHGTQDSQMSNEDIFLSDSTSVVGGQVVPTNHKLQQQALLFKAYHSKTQVNTGEAIETQWKTNICTASALTPRILITAAHCYIKGAELHRVELPAGDKKVAYKALKVIPHPDYDENPEADLALVLLEFALPESAHLVHLPSRSALIMKAILAAGYGRNEGRRSLPGGSGVLRATLLDIDKYDSSTATFTVEQRFGKGICQGDSGGPALVHVNGKDTVVGVVSKTAYQANEENEDPDICGHKGIYVNVQHYLDWIEPTVKELSYE